MTTAGWPRRIAALFIDWFIALLSAAAVTGMTIPPQGVLNGLIASGFFFVEVSLITGLLGYSIGKRVVGLKVVREDGSPIGFARAMLRTALVSLVLPALINTEQRRGLQDIAAGSMVVRAV